jgi:hypothetical protein
VKHEPRRSCQTRQKRSYIGLEVKAKRLMSQLEPYCPKRDNFRFTKIPTGLTLQNVSDVLFHGDFFF